MIYENKWCYLIENKEKSSMKIKKRKKEEATCYEYN